MAALLNGVMIMKNLLVAVLALALSAVYLAPSQAFAFAHVSSIDSSEAQSAILSAGSRAGQVAQLRTVPSIGVIDLSWAPRSLDDGTAATFAEFHIMAQKSASGIHSLQRALAKNPATRAAIGKTRVSIGSIVGVNVGSNGALRLFILR
jgi:hypothetical protein